MAIEDIWESRDVLLTVYSGVVTGQELVESALKKSGDSRFDDLKFILADWRSVKKVDISPEDVKHLVACLRSIAQLCPNAKNASVVNLNDAGVSLTAWYKFLAEDLAWKIEIFHDIEEARNWYKNST